MRKTLKGELGKDRRKPTRPEAKSPFAYVLTRRATWQQRPAMGVERLKTEGGDEEVWVSSLGRTSPVSRMYGPTARKRRVEATGIAARKRTDGLRRLQIRGKGNARKPRKLAGHVIRTMVNEKHPREM